MYGMYAKAHPRRCLSSFLSSRTPRFAGFLGIPRTRRRSLLRLPGNCTIAEGARGGVRARLHYPGYISKLAQFCY
eukprot:1994273-Rhodomonas_salina.3